MTDRILFMFMAEATAITIGNFDGVHRGHEQLIRAARQQVGKHGKVIVLAFDPHPSTVLRPDAARARLSTIAQRTRCLQDAGADHIVTLNPTRQLLSQTSNEFILRISDEYTPSFIVEGPDFHFGKGRAGSVQTLRELESTFGYRTIVIDPVEAALTDQSIVTVSSSMIRWLLQRGRVRDAAILLGRPYELVSTVVSGDKRGRTIGTPTINLADNGCLLPGDGIYAGKAEVRYQKSEVRSQSAVGLTSDLRPLTSVFPAAISIGTKPTFGEHSRVCEAHLIGYDGPLEDYGWSVRLQFTDWLRDQLTYTSVEPLIDQLKRDVANTVKALGTRHQALVLSA